MRAKDDPSTGKGRAFDSPFLDAEDFVRESAADLAPRASALAWESPFVDAFSPAQDVVEAPVDRSEAFGEGEADVDDRDEWQHETEDRFSMENDESDREVSEASEGELGLDEADADDELYLDYEADDADAPDAPGEAFTGADESPSPTTLRMRAGASAGPVAARILWPALGFPSVIAPRKNGAKDRLDSDPTRSICLLILSNKKYLSKEEVSEYLRIVPWPERTRRQIPSGQAGSFAVADLQVRNDDSGKKLARPQKDSHADAVVFGANRDGEHGVVVSLARSVREFYRKQGLEHLHEVRISEEASARLADGQYHLFWNNEASGQNAVSDEMRLLLDKFARPRRKALGPQWEKKLAFLVDEYKFDYGALHPPYQQSDKQKRFTEVLHPVFVQRVKGSLRIGHVTDTHADVRADVYEENLKRAGAPMSWDGQQLLYKNAPVSYNNFNKSFVEAYSDVKNNSDVILLTGDLIDYGRGHVGLTFAGRHRTALGKLDHYHPDRNWFLFYYLLASGENYTRPVYTILGNHDWRLNPYPPFAPGAPNPKSLIHNYREFEQKGQLKDILRIAHGPGHERAFAYTLSAESALGLLFKSPGAAGRAIAGKMDVKDSPLQTNIESVIWYLLLINPFLDYAFALPSGQQILMIDWAEDEEVMNVDEPRTFMGFGQRPADSLTSLQQWHVKEFAALPGKAKIIGVHAPPIGPYPEWSDQELIEGKKTYASGVDSRARKPDGTIVKLTTHTLFAIRPKDAPFGVAADHGSLVKERDWFIRTVAERGANIRLVLSGHIHRNGLLVAYVPTSDPKARLIRAVNHQTIRAVRPPVVAIRRTASGAMAAYPSPLYVNTTSAGPRGNQYDPDHTAVHPGYAIISLASDGTIDNVSTRQVIPAPAVPAKTREVA